ncbi:MAG: O-antigen ligase family protein, partial [Terracidiphilus sp.]
LVRLIGMLVSFLALLSIAGQFLLPPIHYANGEWAGVFLHKDGLGVAMVVGILSLIVSSRPWTLFRFASVLLCSVLLLLSGAAGAYLWALAGILALAFLGLRGHLRVVFSLSVLGVLIEVPMVIPDFVSFATGLLGKDASFTGRTDLWAVAIRMIMAHPWLGYGEAAFWNTVGQSVGELLGNWQPQHAHNGILEVCLNLGLVGLGLMVLTLIDCFRRMRRVISIAGKGARKWCIAISVVLIVQAADEATFLQVSCLWSVFLIAQFAIWNAERRDEEEALREFAVPPLVEFGDPTAASTGLTAACDAEVTPEITRRPQRIRVRPDFSSTNG